MPRKLVLLFALCATLHAQEPAQPPPLPTGPTGSVVGTVTVVETRLPARFVPVVLVPQPPDVEPTEEANSALHINIIRGTTGIDGRFHIDGVPTGNYLIAAALPGGTNLTAMVALTSTDEQAKVLLASYPVVSVTAGATASTQVLLRIGAVVSGRLQYADGAPVIGGAVEFSAANPTNAKLALRNEGHSTRREALGYLSVSFENRRMGFNTDDTGHFRIYGIPAGKYVLSSTVVLDHHTTASVQYSDGRNSGETGGYLAGEAISVYAPSTFRHREARGFELHGDEQITDADLSIDPQGVHTVRGKLVIAATGTAPIGLIELLDPADRDWARLISLQEDGSFQFTWIPPGNYTLVVLDASIRSAPNFVGQPPGPPPVRFKPVSMNVAVTNSDTTLDNILLTPEEPKDPLGTSTHP